MLSGVGLLCAEARACCATVSPVLAALFTSRARDFYCTLQRQHGCHDEASTAPHISFVGQGNQAYLLPGDLTLPPPSKVVMAFEQRPQTLSDAAAFTIKPGK